MSETHSTDDKLIRMANQIATFFNSQPEGVRIDGIAGHINKFWEPRMRRRLHQLIEENRDGFHEIVRTAASHIHKPNN